MTSLTRRQVLKSSAAAALLLRQPHPPAKGINALDLAPFVDPLLLPQPLPPAPIYRIAMQQIHARMHRDLPPTRLWSYGPGPLAPLIEARANQPTTVEWVNQLPTRHFLPIDYTLHASGRSVPESRAIVHVHGGRTPAASDGYPESWYPPGHSKTCHYPNTQDAAMLWFHDHAMGTNRLNLYAGMMGIYLLRDEHETSLNLPSGPYELPLMIYDRIFDQNGQLFYPVSTDPLHPWVEEVFGEAMVVNGRITPFHPVEPRRYRLRVVNAANGRFFRLALSNDATFTQSRCRSGPAPRPTRA